MQYFEFALFLTFLYVEHKSLKTFGAGDFVTGAGAALRPTPLLGVPAPQTELFENNNKNM
jgi:hypothetical protein